MAGKTVAAVCFFCHDGKGNYLLAKRSMRTENEPGTWSPGSGRLNFGESIDAALLREIKEEYDATPLDIEHLGYRDFINDGGNHVILQDFKVRLDPKEVKNNEIDMCDEIRWIKLSELETWQEPLHPQWVPFWERYKNKLL